MSRHHHRAECECPACKGTASPTPPADGPTPPGPEQVAEAKIAEFDAAEREWRDNAKGNPWVRIKFEAMATHAVRPLLTALAASREEAARLAAERDKLAEENYRLKEGGY